MLNETIMLDGFVHHNPPYIEVLLALLTVFLLFTFLCLLFLYLKERTEKKVHDE